MSLLLDKKIESDSEGTGILPRVDYHCHISMMEYADLDNPTIVSVTKEEFINDLDEAGIDKAVILSDKNRFTISCKSSL